MLSRVRDVNKWLIASVLIVTLLVSTYLYISVKYTAMIRDDVVVEQLANEEGYNNLLGFGLLMTQEELDKTVRLYQLLYRMVLVPSDSPSYDESYAVKQQPQILQELIDTNLLKAYAKQEEIDLEDKSQVMEQTVEWLEDIYDGEQGWQQVLQEHQISEEHFFDHLYDSHLVSMYKVKKTADIVVSQQEIQDYYEENKINYAKPPRVSARHILVEELETAEDLLEQLQGGADFQQLAQEHSLDKADEGGNLGWFQPGTHIDEFEKVAFSLDAEEISGIVETRLGYHIIKVEEKTNQEERALSDVYEIVQQDALRAKREHFWQNYLITLRSNAGIIVL